MSSATIPGPTGISMLPHIRTVLRMSSDPLPLLREHYARYGVLSASSASKPGKQLMLLAFGEAYNQPVLSNPATYHSITSEMLRDSALKRLMSGLVNMNGERHKGQRRLMMPAFHKQAVAGYHALFAEEACALLERWGQAKQTNLMPDLRGLVLRIVSRALFGLNDPALSQRVGASLTAWVRMANTVRYQMLPGFRGQLKRFSESIERDLSAIIEDRRRNPGPDVLSTLISAHDEDGAKLTDDELIGHLAVLFVAGHETTANALAWTLILLSRDPVLRLALVEEITGATGGGVPTVEQALSFPLLDRVIKESLRLLPPALLTVRLAAHDTELAGIPIKKSNGVILSHFISHRLPEVFSHPDRFDPSRWEHADPSPYAYIPFSAGPRLCIGAAFASLEMRVVLSILLPALQITPLSPVDTATTGGILHPKGDVPVKLTPARASLPAWPMRGTMSALVED